MQYPLVIKTQLEIGCFYGVDIADKIRHTYIRGGQLFTIALVPAQPCNRCGTSLFSDQVPCILGDGIEGVVVQIASFHHGDVFIQQGDHLAGHPCLGLSAQSQEKDVMLAQQGTLCFRYNRVFIANDAGKGAFACF
ncbi:YgiT-type zinc finger protein [Niabella beijingensis]|uniref:YgiT-type zinc finger protein n=1 Tax=Niabella beijingensis TaxID=2872700 RepID=UPI001CBBB63B|nr:YgiT-type zinc finger protein [Niabella beijingensis]